MKICVIGLGYIGLPTASMFADNGNFVIGVDKNPAVIEALSRGEIIIEENGLPELPIIVTEYGAMEECGNPAAMVRYIVSMEKTNTYGNMAFWRLANNLNDTAADDNSPNANWWLYRKYAEMDGRML